jgi:hypothetical protein
MQATRSNSTVSAEARTLEAYVPPDLGMGRKECSAALLGLLVGPLVRGCDGPGTDRKPAHQRRLLNWLWTVTWRAWNRVMVGALLLSTLRHQSTGYRHFHVSTSRQVEPPHTPTDVDGVYQCLSRNVSGFWSPGGDRLGDTHAGAIAQCGMEGEGPKRLDAQSIVDGEVKMEWVALSAY